MLVSEIWLDWLKDEIKMASEISEREKVYELFERAVKDYICEFLIYAIKHIVTFRLCLSRKIFLF